MTADVPRRLRPRAPQRRNTVDKTKGAPSAKGTTGAARPVATGHRAQQYVPPTPASPVTVGDTTGQTESVAITLTTGTVAGAVATGFRATAVGWEAEALGGNSTAVGAQAFASDGSAIAVGSAAVAEATSALAIGTGTDASGTPSIAIGTLDTGFGVHATAAGTVAIGADSSLGGAQAHNENEFALGTENHIVIVAGKLIMADDATGDLYHVVLSGGALSFVAYP